MYHFSLVMDPNYLAQNNHLMLEGYFLDELSVFSSWFDYTVIPQFSIHPLTRFEPRLDFKLTPKTLTLKDKIKILRHICFLFYSGHEIWENDGIEHMKHLLGKPVLILEHYSTTAIPELFEAIQKNNELFGSVFMTYESVEDKRARKVIEQHRRCVYLKEGVTLSRVYFHCLGYFCCPLESVVEASSTSGTDDEKKEQLFQQKENIRQVTTLDVDNPDESIIRGGLVLLSQEQRIKFNSVMRLSKDIPFSSCSSRRRNTDFRCFYIETPLFVLSQEQLSIFEPCLNDTKRPENVSSAETSSSVRGSTEIKRRRRTSALKVPKMKRNTLYCDSMTNPANED